MTQATAAFLLALLVLACRGPSAPPNVILILVDTLRADHLGVYGYARDTSPALDEFAAGATVFENAISQAPHTIPSVLQIMTGRYLQGERIHPDHPTLAELLAAEGYETAAIVDNPSFENSENPHGLRRGFSRFYRNGLLHRGDLAQQLWKTPTSADTITAQAIRWLRAREPERPFFLWLHYFDPHDPYLPPFAENMEELSWRSGSPYTGDIRSTELFRRGPGSPDPGLSAEDRAHLIALYDAEIRYFDQSLGELLGFLENEGILRDSLLILSADHGESLGEHGVWTHGLSLYEPEIHVPLVLQTPGQRRGTRVSRPVQALDIPATVLDVLGLEVPEGQDGRSLLRPEPEEPALVFWKDWQVARSADWKLIERGGGRELYHLRDDPGELRNRIDDHPETAAELARARDQKLVKIAADFRELRERSTEAVERLRSLGYLR